MAFTNIQKVRVLVQDTEPGLYFLEDEELQFLLERNSNNVDTTAIEACKLILLKLSMRGNESVDIFSFSGSKSAEQYRLSLKLFLDNSYLNPILKNVQGRIGGTKFSEIDTNVQDADNNIVNPPERNQRPFEQDYFKA